MLTLLKLITIHVEQSINVQNLFPYFFFDYLFIYAPNGFGF